MERQTFDAKYLDRLIAGDPDTELHFTRYFGELIRIKLRARIRSPQWIDDAQQETFLRVFRTLRQGSIQHPERIGAFVNSVCNNVMLEMFRSGNRFADTQQDEPLDVRDEAPSPDELLITDETRRKVREVLAALPEKDRELLRRVFLREEDKDEVCRGFGIDREYLRVLLHRAKLRMRDQLNKAHFVRSLFALVYV